MALGVQVRVNITGTSDVIKRINEEIAGIEGRTLKGLVAAGTLVKDKAYAYTPYDPAGKNDPHLRDTSYVEPLPGSRLNRTPMVEVGYTASYAPAVHEITERKSGGPIKYTTPGTGAKFLERSVQENFGSILEIIRRTVLR